MAPIDELALKWSIAKQREEAAKADRIAIEEQILKIHAAKEEGSETVTTPNGVKVRLTGKLTYKADLIKLQALTASWPEDARPIKTEVKADEAKLKVLRSSAPKAWAEIASAVTVAPAKTNVAIEFKE
jgi:hypothetical protein